MKVTIELPPNTDQTGVATVLSLVSEELRSVTSMEDWLLMDDSIRFETPLGTAYLNPEP